MQTAKTDQTRIRDKLDRLATWTPTQFKEELPNWTPESIIGLWDLLENSFRDMCRGFGSVSPAKRVSSRGIHTNQQIRRLAVIQTFAEKAMEEIKQ